MKTKKLKRMHMAFKWVYNAGLPLYETLKNMKEFRKDKSTKKEFDKIYESQPWIMADATYNEGDTIKHRGREFKVICAHGHKIEVKEIMKTKKHKVKKSIMGYGWRIDKKELPKTWEEYTVTNDFPA